MNIWAAEVTGITFPEMNTEDTATIADLNRLGAIRQPHAE